MTQTLQLITVMFHASEFVLPGIAAVIANTQPLMAAVLSALVLKEIILANWPKALKLQKISVRGK